MRFALTSKTICYQLAPRTFELKAVEFQVEAHFMIQPLAYRKTHFVFESGSV